jgi:endoglucanase
MNRRGFIQKTIMVGTVLGNTGFLAARQTQKSGDSDINYNLLPKWCGFNIQEEFTHKPYEWLNIAPEWGFRNEPFRESDFALIVELGFNFVRLPMSYKYWNC